MRSLAICILVTSLGCALNIENDERPIDGVEIDEDEQQTDEVEIDNSDQSTGRVEMKEPDRPLIDTRGIAECSNRFAIDLFHQLRSAEGNLFFSPASISLALSMTYAGAEGKTKLEMEKTLHVEKLNGELHQQMQALLTSWNHADNRKGIKLSLANRLWGQSQFDFRDSFTQFNRKWYNADLTRLNFQQSDEARQTINTWVEKQTNKKIKNLIPPDTIDPDTRLVLTNAVYFAGTWANQFKKERTSEGDFYVTSASKVQVPLMHNSESYGHGQFESVDVLEMPYGDGSFSMVVLLPRAIAGLSELESQLNYENLQKWTSKLRKREVSVTLPKFQMTSEFDLPSTLNSLGMVSAFDPQHADFSGMTEHKRLFIDAVIHKATVDVHEEGTEAAAATGVVMKLTSMPPTFRADRPFVFIIRDNRNGAILFIGRMKNPKQ